MGLEADARAATVTMLSAYAASVSPAVKLQVYAGRPRSLNPPTAFVDRISETIEYVGITLRQRSPRVEVIVVHGSFDSADSAAQKDAFVDGFLDWVTNNYHAAGANTLIAITSVDDLPTWVPDWLPPERQSQYYATSISLEGYAEN
jgi:hypothetical protein